MKTVNDYRNLTRAQFAAELAGTNCAAIGRRYGVSKTAVQRRAHSYGIEVTRRPLQKLPDVATVREWLQTMTYAEIAQRAGCSRQTVANYVTAHNLQGESKLTRRPASSTHHERLEAEFEPGALAWLRRPLTRRTAPGRLSYWVQGGPDTPA